MSRRAALTFEAPEGALWAVLEHYEWELPAPRPGWQTVKCGAHEDSHGSCRLNNDLGAGRCQACGWGGDVISIIQGYEGRDCDFKAALSILAGILGEDVSGARSQSGRRSSLPRHARDHTPDRGYVPPRLRTR